MSFLLTGEIMFNNLLPTGGSNAVGNVARNLGLTYNNAPYRDFQRIDAIEASRRPAPTQQFAGGGGGGGGGFSAPNYNAQAMAAINRSADLLNQREGSAMTNLDREVASQRGTLQANVKSGQENLARQLETTTRQKTASLRDLSQNIRNAYQSGMNRLGIAGAADSSAAKMYEYALGQQEAQNRGQLVSDYQYNVGNIDIKNKQLERDYQTKLSALDNWKQSQAFAIRDRFLEARDRLEQQRASLGGQYVAQATAQLAETAAGNLANLSDQVNSAAGVIQNDFANAAAELRELNQANVNPNVGLRTSGGTDAGMTVGMPLPRRNEE
jgi:hypothetical protein